MKRLLFILILVTLISGGIFHHRSVMRRQLIMSAIEHYDTIIKVVYEPSPPDTIYETQASAAEVPDTTPTPIAQPKPRPVLTPYVIDTPYLTVLGLNPKSELLMKFYLEVTLDQKDSVVASQLSFISKTSGKTMAYKLSHADRKNSIITYTSQSNAYIPAVNWKKEPYGLSATVKLDPALTIIDFVPYDPRNTRSFHVVLRSKMNSKTKSVKTQTKKAKGK